MKNELANWILCELEEAQYEEIVTLLQTVTPRSGTIEELAAFQSALQEIVTGGYATMVPEHAPNEKPTDLEMHDAVELIERLPALMKFDASRRYWLYAHRVGPPYTLTCPGVALTPQGLGEAVSLLNTRGYGWWKR